MNTIAGLKMGEIDVGQTLEGLLMQWLDKKVFLCGRKKTVLFEMGCGCLESTGLLYKLNKALIKKQEYLAEEDGECILEAEAGRNTLTYHKEKMEFTGLELREIIAGMIDILEEVLPLGTVVDLKKRYLQKHIPASDIENIKIVITQRFLYHENDRTYFPYAGSIYPVGMLDKNEIIHFTPAMIETVVHRGYSDRQDRAYAYRMKQELILEKGMHSYGFSTEEERDKLRSRMEGGRG